MGIFLAYVGFVFFSVLYVQQGLSSQGKSVLTGTYTFACAVSVFVCLLCVQRMARQMW